MSIAKINTRSGMREYLKSELGLNQDQADFLNQVTNPFSDFPMRLQGMPNSQKGSSLVRAFTRDIIVPSRGAGSSIHIYLTPFLNVFRASTVNGGTPWTDGTGQGLVMANDRMPLYVIGGQGVGAPFGGCMIYRSTGSDNTISQAPGNAYAVLQPRLSATAVSGTTSLTMFHDNTLYESAIVGCAIEVRDLSNELSQQGNIRITEIPDVIEDMVTSVFVKDWYPTIDDGSTVIMPTMPVRALQRFPVNAGEAGTYPESVSWELKKGCYAVARLNDLDNKTQMQKTTPFILSTFDVTSNTGATDPNTAAAATSDLHGFVGQTYTALANAFSVSAMYATPKSVANINPLHIICDGLNAASSIQVRVRWFIEDRVPVNNEVLKPLLQPSNGFDPELLSLISRTCAVMPIAVPVSENARGGWLNSIVKTVKSVAPILLAGAERIPALKPYMPFVTEGLRMGGEMMKLGKQSKEIKSTLSSAGTAIDAARKAQAKLKKEKRQLKKEKK